MCMKTDCDKCSKPTWKGCGKHIEQALKDVPEDERCKCPRDSSELTATAVKKTEETKVETKADHEIKTEVTKADHEVKSEEVKAETRIDSEVKTAETKEKVD